MNPKESESPARASEREPLLPASGLQSQQTLADGVPRHDQNRRRELVYREDTLPSSISTSIIESPDGPSSLAWRICAAMFSFFVVGMHVASVGVCFPIDNFSGVQLPYLATYYDLNATLVSLIFVAPLVGYLAASLVNSTIHLKLGQRGIAIIGPTCQLLHALVLSVAPPYPLALVFFSISGFGIGLIDGAWCAWAGGMSNVNTIQGFLHGSFSAGATFGPWIATTMFAKSNLPWYTFYHVMTGAIALELGFLTWAFRHADASQYCSDKPQSLTFAGSHMKEALRSKVTWICALYLLAEVGTESAVSGWIVTFMMRVRFASAYVSGICSSAFWFGTAFGRVLLGFVTDRYGTRLSVTVYLLIAITLEVIFWLVTQIAVSVVMITLLGFFIAPLFPAGVGMVAGLLPRELHVSAVCFVAAVGQLGGAIFPFALGALAERWGLQLLQPLVLVLLVIVLLFWLSFPRAPKQQD